MGGVLSIELYKFTPPKLDLLYNLKIIEEFLGKMQTSRSIVNLCEKRRQILTLKLPIRIGYARAPLTAVPSIINGLGIYDTIKLIVSSSSCNNSSLCRIRI